MNDCFVFFCPAASSYMLQECTKRILGIIWVLYPLLVYRHKLSHKQQPDGKGLKDTQTFKILELDTQF